VAKPSKGGFRSKILQVLLAAELGAGAYLGLDAMYTRIQADGFDSAVSAQVSAQSMDVPKFFSENWKEPAEVSALLSSTPLDQQKKEVEEWLAIPINIGVLKDGISQLEKDCSPGAELDLKTVNLPGPYSDAVPGASSSSAVTLSCDRKEESISFAKGKISELERDSYAGKERAEVFLADHMKKALSEVTGLPAPPNQIAFFDSPVYQLSCGKGSGKSEPHGIYTDLGLDGKSDPSASFPIKSGGSEYDCRFQILGGFTGGNGDKADLVSFARR
jgi:hypothetical protein